MSQGHALSVLTRAYRKTTNDKYLTAAVKALQLFKHATFIQNISSATDEINSDRRTLPTKQTGVSSKFMNQFLWFEEYPTQPNTFVLNGFMYSLIGLYDLWHTVKTFEASKNQEHIYSEGVEAGDLFLRGLNSLNIMLPLYDTGSRSVYDLRHVTMPGVEPKVARWDYHAVHINLLYLLSTIHDAASDINMDLIQLGKEPAKVGEESVLLGIAERWLGYMFGKRAEHN